MDDILVSVVLPVYNTPETILKEAVESILKQTYKNIELILVNDGSGEECRRVLDSFCDERIKRIDNEVNLKLPKVLNKGISVAKGKYIVRMDSDDISRLNRIEREVAFMESHPDVAIAGTLAKTMDTGEIIGALPKLKREDFQVRLIFGNTGPVHPTVIMRADFLMQNNIRYNKRMLDAEDYALWVQASKYGTIAGINEVLLKYRRYPADKRTDYLKRQEDRELEIIHLQLEVVLRRYLNDIEIEEFERFRKYDEDVSFPIMNRLINEIMYKNRKRHVYCQKSLDNYFSMIWLVLMKKKIERGRLLDCFRYWQSWRSLFPGHLAFSIYHKWIDRE